MCELTAQATGPCRQGAQLWRQPWWSSPGQGFHPSREGGISSLAASGQLSCEDWSSLLSGGQVTPGGREGGRERGESILSLQSLVTSRGLMCRLFASPCLVSCKNWGRDGWAVALGCLLFRFSQWIQVV